MYTPKADEAANQQLKVQRLVIKSNDSSMYSSASGSTCVLVREPVDEVYLASSKDDSANTLTQYNQASLSIVDSSDTSKVGDNGDRGAICISGLASLDTNDCIIVEYKVRLS